MGKSNAKKTSEARLANFKKKKIGKGPTIRGLGLGPTKNIGRLKKAGLHFVFDLDGTLWDRLKTSIKLRPHAESFLKLCRRSGISYSFITAARREDVLKGMKLLKESPDNKNLRCREDLTEHSRGVKIEGTTYIKTVKHIENETVVIFDDISAFYINDNSNQLILVPRFTRGSQNDDFFKVVTRFLNEYTYEVYHGSADSIASLFKRKFREWRDAELENK